MPEGSLILTLSTDNTYNVVKQKICGFEWEAEATVNGDIINIVIWCNREVESNLWRGRAEITINNLGDYGSPVTMCKHVNIFHKSSSSATFSIPYTEIIPGNVEIKLELNDISGYRDPSLFAIDFTKSSTLADLCVGFQGSDARFYVSTQYLSVHSSWFAHLFARIKASHAEIRRPISKNSDFGTVGDLDVISVIGNETTTEFNYGERIEELVDEIEFFFHGWFGCFVLDAEDHPEYVRAILRTGDDVFILKGVDPDDFLLLLQAICPPFAEITDKNLPSLLAICSRFGVEHMLWKTERYLLTVEAQQSFDLLQRLKFATLYKMAALQSDCLSKLRTANDVRRLLDNPHLESCPNVLRSVLLETLLQRFRTDPIAGKAVDRAPAAQNFASNLFNMVDAPNGKAANSAGVEEDQKSSVDNTEIALLRVELIKQKAMRMSLEMSLKTSSAEKKPPAVPPHRNNRRVDHGYLKVRDLQCLQTHEIFADLIPPPFTTLNNVTYSFVNQLFTKRPLFLVLDGQLDNDDLSIAELRDFLHKRLREDFNLYCANIKAGYITDALPCVTPSVRPV